MAEKPSPGWIRPGLHFDPAPGALDLYRLLCIFLADQKAANLSVKFEDLSQLRDEQAMGEIMRILISSAVTLRIAFDQYARRFPNVTKLHCGMLWPNWPKKNKQSLNIREACNKIIHATNIHPDLVNPCPHIPEYDGSYRLPHVYLYGKQNHKNWRAKLSIIDFVKHGSAVYMRVMGR